MNIKLEDRYNMALNTILEILKQDKLYEFLKDNLKDVEDIDIYVTSLVGLNLTYTENHKDNLIIFPGK